MRSKKRLKSRWEGEVFSDSKKLKGKNWTCLFKDRKAWYELAQKSETHKEL